MPYVCKFTDSAIKELDRLDKSTAQKIIKRFKERVASQDDPTIYAKPLRKELFGLWRLRVDDYRVVFRVVPEKGLIQVTRVGHRSDVYE